MTEKTNWNQGDRRAFFFDYNFDGLLDLIVENSGFPPSSRLVLFKQQKDNSFSEVSKFAGIDVVNPSGTIMLDVNIDGKMDLITGQTDVRDNTLKKRIYLFENRVEWEGRRSLRIFLRGKNANVQGIGAMVLMKTSKGIRRHWVEYSHGGLPSQNEEGIYFGLEKGEKIDSAVIRWPISDKSRKPYKAETRFKYEFSKLDFNYHYEVTLYDDGSWKGGRP